MSVAVVYKSDVTVAETLANNTDSASATKRVVTHDEFNTDLSLIVTSPVTKVAAFVQALSTGTATIDLCDLTGTNGASVSGDGLKVQVFKMKNLGDNVMSITFGGTHPYEMMGSDFKVELDSGTEFLFYGNDATPDIASDSADKMDLAGTDEQTCEIMIVMG